LKLNAKSGVTRGLGWLRGRAGQMTRNPISAIAVWRNLALNVVTKGRRDSFINTARQDIEISPSIPHSVV
jgi:hypothetical protein